MRRLLGLLAGGVGILLALGIAGVFALRLIMMCERFSE